MTEHPFHVFFGVPASADSASLLGLAGRSQPNRVDATQIESALRLRLAAVFRHPLGRSPQADYVRHELRKAADALLRDNAAGEAKPPAAGTLPSWASRRRRSPVAPVFNLTAFDRLVLSALVASGGWNAQSRARLVSLAASHGVTVEGLLRVLRGLSQYAKAGGAHLGVNEITAGQTMAPYPSTSPPPTIGAAVFQRLTESLSAELKREDPWPTIKLSILFGALTLALGVIGARMILVESGTRQPLKNADTQPIANGPPSITSAAPIDAPGIAPQESHSRIASFPKRPTMLGNALPHEALQAAGEATLLVNRLDEIARKLAVEAEPSDAVYRHWDHDVNAMATAWTLIEPSVSRQLTDRLLEALRVAGDRPSVSDRLLQSFVPPPLLAQPLDLWRGAWKAGMLAALAHASPNTGLPPVVSQAAHHLLSATTADDQPLPTIADAASRQWLDSQIPALVQTTLLDERYADFWELWLAANRSLGRDDSHDESMIRALHAVMATPNDLARPSPLVNVLGRLTAVTLEHPGTVSRRGVMGFLNDESLESRDLWVFTSLIAMSDEAAWFPDRLVVRDDADQRLRWRIRDEVGSIWPQASLSEGAENAAPQGRAVQVEAALALRWSAAVDASMASAPDRLPEFMMWHLVRASRLNEVAEALAARRHEYAERLLVEIETNPAPSMTGPADGSPTGRVGHPAGPDAAWMQAYQAAGTASQPRIDLLRALRTSAGGDLGPIDADLFVREVYRASPIEVRAVAQEVVQQFSNGPTICLAMLDHLADAGNSDTTSRMISEFTGHALPAPRSSGWNEQARIALLSHALSVIPQGRSGMDELSIVLANSYAARENLWRQTEQTTGTPDSPQEAVRLLTQTIMRDAEQLVTSAGVPDDLPGLQRRRLARLRLAEGPVQQFAAQQLAVLDLLAYITVAEQPGKRGVILDLLRRAADARLRTNDVLAQCLLIERAIALVWRHRLGLETFGRDVPVLGDEQFAEATVAGGIIAEAQAEVLSSSVLADWKQRLEALDPSDPLAYFELAEEVADGAMDQARRRLAARLFALSATLDSARLGRSAALALAAMEEDPTLRRRLLALALLVGGGVSVAGGFGPDAATAAVGEYTISSAIALSEALGYYRRGQGPRAIESLRRGGADALLTKVDRILPQGADRIREDCRHYKGQARPTISDEQRVRMLRLELALLSSSGRSWSGDLLLTAGRPLIEVDPERLPQTFGVDAGRPYFRNGRWVSRPE